MLCGALRRSAALCRALQKTKHALNPISNAQVLSNKLKAHVAAYKAIKASPEGRHLSVGLVHHHITFLATGPRWLRWMAQ